MGGGGENIHNEGLSRPYVTMGLSKLNPPSLCFINKEIYDNGCTMGLLKAKAQASAAAHERPATHDATLAHS